MITLGYIPEHFSAPMFLAERHGFFKNRNLDVEFVAFPSGSGHLIESLEQGKINVAVGLTEAFIRAIATGHNDFRILGTYVESPLCWAASAGADSKVNSLDELENGTFAVSRMGSGSEVMARVLHLNKKWTSEQKFEVNNTFAQMRDAVNGKGPHPSDVFLWEHFTSKKYHDSGEIKRVGEIYTPWPSWVAVASRDLISSGRNELQELLAAINEGVAYFGQNTNEALQLITDKFDYSMEDATAWLGTVRFSSDVRKIDPEMVRKTVEVLKLAAKLPEDSEEREYFVDLE